MANNPKMMDPTEAALSAIQEALNIKENPLPLDSHLDGLDEPPPPPERGSRRYAPAAVPTYDEPFDPEPFDPRMEAHGLRAANDDQRSIGEVLQALQRRPAHTSYVVAAIFSIAWVVGCVALSWAYLSDLSAALGPGHSPVALMIGLGAGALLPIIFFFGVAHMAWRSQELRLVAQAMANVAMRLAEPETVAHDSIVSVGQAIRREVAAMGDGVERALARASELETLVQNEVAALERAYSDNEVRVRGLIKDLVNQRDTLVAQAEQVRSAISNVHIDLTQDLSTISDLVGQQVSEAAQSITQSLAEKGEHITLALGRVGDNMVQQLSDRGGDLIERLETASEETSRAIATASEQLTRSLNFKADHVTEEFAEIAGGLEDMMTARLDRVTEGFSEKSLAILDMMSGRSQELTDSFTTRAQDLTENIIDTSSRLAETIATRADEVNSTLKASGESLILDLNLRGGDVVTKLEQTGNRITEEIVSRGSKVTDSFRDRAEHLAEVVAAGGDAVKEMLATRLAAFEDMFNHSGAALGEKISRDSSTLGNLITRHLAEFDRTVKTYGSDLVERLGARTQEITESLHSYVDSFDTRVTSKSTEVTTALQQRLGRFEEALDSRTQTLTEALSSRVMDIAKTLTEGGKEIVTALDKRISDVTVVIDTRGAKLAETVGGRIADIDKALGTRAIEVADTLDGRIAHLEELLVGRAEAVTEKLETRTRAAADLLNARLEELSTSIRTSSVDVEQTLAQLTARASEMLGKNTAASVAATEALNRSAAEATASLNQSAGGLSGTIAKSAAAANETIGKTTATAADLVARSVVASREAIARTAGEAERSLSALSTEVTTALKQNVGNVERTLIGTSAEIGRNLVTKADEINTAVVQRIGEMTRILDEKSSGLIAALSGKGQEFAGDVSRVTDQAVKAIEAKSFVFTQTMMDNSQEIARLINEASQSATAAVTRSLGQLQDGTRGAVDDAKTTVSRTLDELHSTTKASIEESKQTASATVADMLETHGMLRSDTTALFERLREANILLQEVLSGAHDNMSSIEHTMVTRVSEFVAAMNEVSGKAGATNARVEEHLGTFNNVTAKVLSDLGELATQFNTHGRSLAEAVELLERGNRKTAESVAQRQTTIETLVTTLDARTGDFEERLRRFSGLLEESLDSATTRAREIASIIAETSGESVRTIEQQFELVRTTSEEERKRTGETLNAVYDQAAAQVHNVFSQSATRFSEIVQGMKQMAGEMQQELEATRAELRRGILELPQETSDTAAQMRRVIVDQIEALAELNRIVARHGRSLDTSEAGRREAEPVLAIGGGRAQVAALPPRVDLGPPPPPAMRRDITGAPTRRSEPAPAGNALLPAASKESGNGRNGGWLSDILTRASRDESPPIAPPTPRAQRDTVDTLESLSVDIARMIDHDAAAELWERYKRGERNGLFSRRLYTAQGHKAFEEIRRKYRGDAEFRQTVEQYIHEFERLVDDVSRGERGAAVARNYLTSDTGKVYTMLAHAAGRFEQ